MSARDSQKDTNSAPAQSADQRGDSAHELVLYDPKSMPPPLALTCPVFAPLGWTGEAGRLSLEEYHQSLEGVKIKGLPLWSPAVDIMTTVDRWAAESGYEIHAVVAGGLAAWPFAAAAASSASDQATTFPSDCDVFLWRDGPHDAAMCNRLAAHLYTAVTELVEEIDGHHDAITVGQGIFNVNKRASGETRREYQLILKVFGGVADILNSFDLNSAKVACDSEGRVWMTRGSLRANVYRINTLDPAARSITYERRLVKYFERGYAIEFPHLSDIPRHDFTLSPKNNPSGRAANDSHTIMTHRLQFQVVAVLRTWATLGFGKLSWTGLDEYDARRAHESGFYASEPHTAEDFVAEHTHTECDCSKRLWHNLRCFLSGHYDSYSHIALSEIMGARIVRHLDYDGRLNADHDPNSGPVEPDPEDFSAWTVLGEGNVNPLALYAWVAPRKFSAALTRKVCASGKIEYLAPLLKGGLAEYAELRTDEERQKFLGPHVAKLIAEIRAAPLPLWVYPAGARAARLPAPETPERWYGDRYGVAPPPTLPPGGVPDYVSTLIIDTCAICREPLYDGKNVLKLPCGHAFHWAKTHTIDCPGLKKALKNETHGIKLTCPSCRAVT